MAGMRQESRSRVMRAVRKRDTSPEVAVRRTAHRAGLRFRLYRRDLPGTPDLVFPRWKVAMFVHGCFWHQHEGCRLANWPRSNLEYWGPKLRRNVERDAWAQAELERLGWRVVVIWECEIQEERLAERIVEAVTGEKG